MIIKDFHNVRFPEDISYGSSGGPGFKTTVLELSSGHEQRNIDWSMARANYDVSYGVKTREQMEDLLEFFYARRGKAYGFRFKDWMDFKLERQQIANQAGNSALNLQIFKRYEAETSYFYDRPLLKIVPGTVFVFDDGLLIPSNEITVDYDTGRITGNRAGAGIIEVQCEFDVPVRFNTDDIMIAHDDWETMSWPSIPLVELKPRSA